MSFWGVGLLFGFVGVEVSWSLVRLNWAWLIGTWLEWAWLIGTWLEWAWLEWSTSFIVDFSNVAWVSIDVVLDTLETTIGKLNVVRPLGVVTVTGFLVSEFVAGGVVTHSPVEVVFSLGGFVGFFRRRLQYQGRKKFNSYNFSSYQNWTIVFLDCYWYTNIDKEKQIYTITWFWI